MAKTASNTEGEAHVLGVTTFRVPTRDRTFVEEVTFKGWRIRLADWLHLANPDDPSRPIVAQVFKVWVSDEVYVYRTNCSITIDSTYIFTVQG